MSNQVTYLIGAGASAQALPVVNGIPIAMTAVRDLITGLPFSTPASRELQEKFIQEWELTRLAIDDHASADTYAKKLYLQEDWEGLTRLKLVLSILFTILQTKESGFDKRYDAFFASILSRLDDFPKNLRILSWNYDQQFEMAYSRFSKEGLEMAHQKLSVQFKHLGKSLHNSYSPDNFSIIKLNGSTGLVGDNSSLRSLLSQYRVDKKQNEGKDPKLGYAFNLNLVEYLLGKFDEIMLPFRNHANINLAPLMSFAWEKENYDENHIWSKANMVAQRTEVLVVIGYSFPYFNRETDKMIFGNMRKLEKIYIQDMYPNDIEDRIKTLFPKPEAPYPSKADMVKFIYIKNLEQFVLPFEL